jgi:hypothetical protein
MTVTLQDLPTDEPQSCQTTNGQCSPIVQRTVSQMDDQGNELPITGATAQDEEKSSTASINLP